MEYHAPDWQRHIMGPSSGQQAFVEFESKESEISAIEGALQALVVAHMISDTSYDHHMFDMFLSSVALNFDIPWTGVSPRMRRMIYAINAIKRPQSVVCAGIFCGYTFICNAGASIGSGACYSSKHVVGIEILEREAALSAKNLEKFSPGSGSTIICADAAEWLATECPFNIDLLYIDAKSIDFDPTKPQGSKNSKSEYLKIIESSMHKINRGALILAHNSVNAADTIQDYLKFVRSKKFQASINLIIDDAGLEVSLF